MKDWRKKIDEAWDKHWTGTVNSFIGDDGTNHYPLLRKEIDNIVKKALLSQQEQRDGEKFTKTEIEQLQSYCEARDRESWYYGPKTQFEKRHSNIVKKLSSLLKESK